MTSPPHTLSPSARRFWEGLAAGELRYQRCDACGASRHPPSLSCRACGSGAWTEQRSRGHGRIYSWVVPRRPRAPSPPAATDRIVVLVELEEGIRVLGHLDEASAPAEFGLPVAAAFPAAGEPPILSFRRTA